MFSRIFSFSKNKKKFEALLKETRKKKHKLNVKAKKTIQETALEKEAEFIHALIIASEKKILDIQYSFLIHLSYSEKIKALEELLELYDNYDQQLDKIRAIKKSSKIEAKSVRAELRSPEILSLPSPS